VLAGEDAGSSYWNMRCPETITTGGYLQNTHKEVRLLLCLSVT
jgi:hypothetical protein